MLFLGISLARSSGQRPESPTPGQEVSPKFEFEFQILELLYVETVGNQFQIGHGPSCWEVYGPVFWVWLGLETHRYWLGPVSVKTQSLSFEASLWEDVGSAFYWGGSTRRFRIGPSLDWKRSSCRLGRFLPNSKTVRPTRIISEMSPESAFGELLGLYFTGGGSTRRSRTNPVGVGPVSPVTLGCSLRQIPSSSITSGMAPFLSSFRGGSSGLQVTPVPSSPASTIFGFPLSLALDPNFSAVSAHSPTTVFKFIPLRPLQIPQPDFAPLSLDGAAGLGEKLRSFLPMVVSKPFQQTTGGRRN
jgi:hypothetical protein